LKFIPLGFAGFSKKWCMKRGQQIEGGWTVVIEELVVHLDKPSDRMLCS
jgi:hypothetical protein